MKLSWTTLFVTDSIWKIGICDIGTNSAETPAASSEVRPNAAASAEVTSGGGEGSVLIEELGADLDGIGAKVVAAIEVVQALGARTPPLVVGLPSSWCFGATLNSAGLLRRQRRQGLLYRFEEILPVDAEALTADFIENKAGVLGVAALNSKVKPLLDELENAGLTVAHFCPTALLVHQGYLSEVARLSAGHPLPSFSLIATDTDSVDLVASDSEDILAWRSIPTDGDAICEELRTLGDANDSEFAVLPIGLTDQTAIPFMPNVNGYAGLTRTDPFKITTRHAEALLREGKPPLVDLRRGDLSGQGNWQRIATPAWAAMLAAILLMLSIGVLNSWQAHRYQQQAVHSTDAQAELFRETFPEQQVPAAVLSRFRSEAAKARGLTGQDEALPTPATTLQDLHDVLAGLSNRANQNPASPDDALRFQVLELRLEPSRLYIDGQTRSHADSDRLAAGLRETTSFTIDPPRTQNIAARPSGRGTTSSDNSGVVGFTISGQREGERP